MIERYLLWQPLLRVQRFISAVLLHWINKQNTQKSVFLRFPSLSWLHWHLIWHCLIDLSKQTKTWSVLSKIGLIMLNVGQKDEFCVKLVAPLQHNQMMWHHFNGGHVFGSCISLNLRAEERIKILSFIERLRKIIFYEKEKLQMKIHIEWCIWMNSWMLKVIALHFNP